MFHKIHGGSQNQHQVIFAIAFSVILISIEVLLVSTHFDASLLAGSLENPLALMLRKSAIVIQWFSVAASAYLIIFLSEKDRPKLPEAHYPFPLLFVLFLINIAAYLCFYELTNLIFVHPTKIENIFSYLAIAWLALGIVIVVTVAAIIMPLSVWLFLVKLQKAPLVISFVLATLVTSTSQLSKNLWPSLISPTFASSEWLLLRFENQIVSIPEKLYLGIDDFIVHISSTCSGVEGMGLAASFTLLYLYLFKDSLVFPRAFILVPIAAFLSWSFNVLRISLLILLGRYYSPEFAIGGFHSQAGWFFFIAVVLVIIYVFNRISWFKKKSNGAENLLRIRNDLPTAILICFILFSVGTLITGLDDSAMNWLYPIKALLGGIAVIYFWKALNITEPTRFIESTLYGLLACVLWVWIIPADQTFNNNLGAALADSEPLATWTWLGIRFIGSIMIAPIVEELLFRSYLIARVSSQEIDHDKPIAFNLVGIILSSVAFGLIHQQWLAGSVAGLIYAIARYRGNLGSAIWAHAVTNSLLCFYAVSYEQWSYL